MEICESLGISSFGAVGVLLLVTHTLILDDNVINDAS